MLVVGLTGGIATGKSTVSNLLKAEGIPIIDADVIAREVVEPGTAVLKRIVEVFGEEVLLADGRLDRKKLGGIIFNDEGKRRALNGIVHPAVRRGMCKEVMKCWVRGEKMCVVDVPLLIEGGLWKWVGRVVVVYCSADIQLQRLMQRDSSTESEASGRLSSQLPITAKVAYADDVMDNSGSLKDLEEQVARLLSRLRRDTGGLWWLLSWLVPPIGLFRAGWSLGWRRWRRSSSGI